MNKARDVNRLLVRVPNWIGDAVMSLPAVEALKALYPASEITVLSKPWTMPVFYNNPAISEVMEYDARGVHAGFKGKLRLARDLRQRGFRLAVLFQNAFEAAFLALLARIPERVGYGRDLRTKLLTTPVPVSPELLKKHHVFYYLNMVKALEGASPLEVSGEESGEGFEAYEDYEDYNDTSGIIPRIYLTEAERAKALKILRDNGLSEEELKAPLVGAFPGASFGPAKRWTIEGFKGALTAFARDHGAVPVILGGEGDRAISEELSKGLELNEKVRHLNLAGRTTLRELMAVTGLLKLLITNDSGPMHVGAALGTPTIAVFGSTNPTLTGPLGRSTAVVYKGLPCSPCFKRECPLGSGRMECMTAVSPEEVFEAASELLKGATLSGVGPVSGAPGQAEPPGGEDLR